MARRIDGVKFTPGKAFRISVKFLRLRPGEPSAAVPPMLSGALEALMPRQGRNGARAGGGGLLRARRSGRRPRPGGPRRATRRIEGGLGEGLRHDASPFERSRVDA